MNRRMQAKPLTAGALMGLMMLGVVHTMLMSDGTLAGTALIAFLGAHVVLAAIIALLGWWAARYLPVISTRLARLHRPDAAHIDAILTAAAIAAGLVHLLLHGGI